ncbi:MAG: DUF58 domain-containing protein [Clostridia bacterium]|nr:DUF58 domain-containing protein [Clostridia bacterium]
MIVSWLIYLAVIVCGGFFFILYDNVLSLIILATLVLIPILLFIIHTVAYFLTSLEVSVENSEASVSRPIKLNFHIKNRSPFAITHIKMTAKVKNMFLNTQNDCTFTVNAPPFSDKEFVYNINSDYVGNIEVFIKNAKFFDFLSLYRFSKRINVSRVVSVLPESIDSSVKMRLNDVFSGDSQVFANGKSGDDPSEVFNIREYKEGDKLNKIHWKLSSKTEKYMVKEFSLPLSDNVFLFVDLKQDFYTDFIYVNSLICAFTSISQSLAKQNISHYAGWYNQIKEDYEVAKINDISEINEVLSRIYGSFVFYEEENIDKCGFFKNKSYSHAVFMSTNSVEEIEKKINIFDIDYSKKSIVLVTDEADSQLPSTEDIEFIPVVPEYEDKYLCDITL